MIMALQRLIKNFTFNEDIRSGLTFSDVTKVRLNTSNPLKQRIMLKKISGAFSTDADLFIETPFIEPHGLKTWLKFEALVVEDPLTFALDTDLTVQFKIKTSGGNLFWDGADWVPAGASDWSSELDVNENIAALDLASIGDKKLAFVINLATSDPDKTPEVLELKLVGQFEVDVLDDLVYATVIRKLNAEFRSSSILQFDSLGSSSIDLNTVIENTGYKITDIRAVYNITVDPLRVTNLFDSYSPGAPNDDGFTNKPGTIDFTTAIPTDDIIEVVFIFVPAIYVKLKQDIIEVPVFPSLIFTKRREIDDGFRVKDNFSTGRDIVRDKPNLTAVVTEGARQQTIRFEYSIFTNRELDSMRLINDINRFWSNNKSVTSRALGCKFNVNVIDQVNTNSGSDDTDTDEATGSFDILGVTFQDKEAEDVPIVGKGQFNVDASIT